MERGFEGRHPKRSSRLHRHHQPRGQVLDWNPAAERTFGYPRDAALGRNLNRPEFTGGWFVPVDQLQLLKDRATTMGIHFSNNIGIEALRKKINAKLDGEPEKGAEESEEPEKAVRSAPAQRKLTRAEMDQEIRTTQTREQLALVRCIAPSF